MDWKSIGSKTRKMKFFSFTRISSSPFQYWAYPDDVRDILEPFHLLFDLYSMRHNQQPRNDAPNISVSGLETHSGESVKFDLSASSPNCSLSRMEDIQHARVHDPCSQHLSRSEHSHYCRLELSGPGFFAEYHPVEHGYDTSSPKQGELTFYLHYGSSFDIRPYCKTMKFIETKVAAMKLQGFNHLLENK